MESVKFDFTDIQGAKRGILVLFFKPGGEKAVYKLYSFSFFFFLKESATSFCGSVSTAWINWQGKQYLFIKKDFKKATCSVLAWETKHFSPVEIS